MRLTHRCLRGCVRCTDVHPRPTLRLRPHRNYRAPIPTRHPSLLTGRRRSVPTAFPGILGPAAAMVQSQGPEGSVNSAAIATVVPSAAGNGRRASDIDGDGGVPGGTSPAPPAANGIPPQGNGLEDFQHPMEMEEFRRRGKEMIDWICDYHGRVEGLPVRPTVQPGYLAPQLPDSAPEQGEGWDAIMRDVEDHIMPGVTHWQSPNFFAYYPGNSSYPGLLGEMMSGALNIIGFSWLSCPAATELETVVMDWFGKLLALPECYLSCSGTGGGVIQGTASEAAVCALLAARARSMAGRPPSDMGRLVVYSSDQSHSCLKKACMIAGVTHCRLLPTSVETEWALAPETLAAAVDEDLKAGLIPSLLMATIGTTSSAAVDPVGRLAEVTNRHNMWLHVDAAYAGTRAILPELRHEFGGLEAADSFDTNPHKALLVNFDCNCLWVKDAGPLKEALSLTPVYLRGKGNTLDLKDWQIPLGRRFRALKLWFVLRTYGAEGLRAFVRHKMELAKHFARLVRADERFEITAPPRFGLVCFRVKSVPREANAAVLEGINATGKAFLIHTELAGEYAMRMAIGATHTQRRHIDAAWAVIQQQAAAQLEKLQAAGQAN